MKVTTEEFIKRARIIHGNKYDYSKSEYKDYNNTKIKITCPEHGEFLQTCKSHLSGSGCPECKRDKMRKLKLRTSEKFLKEAKNIHPEYDYSKTFYKDEHTLVVMTCPKHGDFSIYPSDFLHKGRGCQYCSGRKMNTLSFIEKSKEKFGNKFNYDKVKYINSKTPVIITCPIHGEFTTVPQNFLRKVYGCSKCSHEATYTQFAHSMSKGEEIISKWLDYNNISYEYNKKILRIGDLTIYPDFVINNIIIEYNGEQHYKYIPYFHKGGIIDFEKQQYRDQKLREYCKDNSIKLVEIRYDQNIEKELEKIKHIFKING